MVIHASYVFEDPIIECVMDLSMTRSAKRLDMHLNLTSTSMILTSRSAVHTTDVLLMVTEQLNLTITS